MNRRMWIGIVLALPVLALAMGGHLPGLDLAEAVPRGVSNWLQLALATPVVLWCGLPFFRRGWASLATRSLNMFTLIALGTGSAFAYSALATSAPRVFPDPFRAADGTVAVYFEAAAAIVVLVLIGQVLELKAREGTGQALRALLRLAPRTACRIGDDDADEEIPLEDVRAGDRLRVRPGDRVPVDGAVLDGRGAVDESTITGEPTPVEKGPNDPVVGGTLNVAGAFVMRAERVGDETMLARIAAMAAGSAADPGADPARRRHGRRLVRSRRARRRGGRVCGLVGVGTGASDGIRSRGGGIRADRRLSLRPRSRHADVDHGGHRARRPDRGADRGSRGAGASREGRYPRRRQDGHPHGGQAQGRHGAGWGFPERGRPSPAVGERRAIQRAPARRGDRRRRPGEGTPGRRGDGVPIVPGTGRPRHRGRLGGRARQSRFPSGPEHVRGRVRGPRGSAPRGRRHRDVRRGRRARGRADRGGRPRQGHDAGGDRGAAAGRTCGSSC